MKLLIDPFRKYQICDECHRLAAHLVELGRMDKDGHIDQESGANVCVNCLEQAVKLVSIGRERLPALRERPAP